MKPFYLFTSTISDAWFQLIYNIFDNSYIQNIQQGSFEKEQFRLQYSGISVYISNPSIDIIPIMPVGMENLAPTDIETIEKYMVKYLMSSELEENETYTYGSRIHFPMPKGGNQYERVLNLLKKTPLTNQAILEIGSPTDFDTCIGNDGKLDPPCLRLLDFKAIPINGNLNDLALSVTSYFRSWDLWAGFPTNLGGIELLKQIIANEVGLKNGPIYAYSAGAHIYGYQEDFVKMRTMRKI